MSALSHADIGREFFVNAPSTFAFYKVTDDQISTLKAYLDNEILTADAAKRLAEHPAASPTPLDMQQRLGGLWTLLNDTAVGVPLSQPKIIAILKMLRTFSRIEEPKGEGKEFVNLDDGLVWRELTGWASDWADNYNMHGSRFLIELCEGEVRAARKRNWISANSYTARLAMTHDPALASYGAALERASVTITRALERDHGEKEPDDLEGAAQLFLHAGTELYRLCREGTSAGSVYGSSHANDKPAAGELWHGEDGFSIGRWEFWKDRWAALVGKLGVSREAYAAVLNAINRAES